ncbi:MAG TPA: hypothetical protein VFP12_09745 [Allosphingosinicella sp.]|nr:hypothetical protein [Allosphingosinicella sp.]
MTSLPLAMILLLSPIEGDPEIFRTRVESAPQKVATFIERRANCNHFTGEEPYDPERAAFLSKTIRELKCARIARDERKLTRSYRDRPEILRLLKDTEDLLGW